MVKFQNKGYSNIELMKVWLTEIFFPEVESRLEKERKRTGYSGKAILILDGFSAHCSALQDFNLDEKHIQLLYLTPHSSHLTQPLDLVIFSYQKFITTRKKLTEKLSEQADKIRAILKGLQQASTSENIVSAFESAGIFHYYTNETINFNNYMPNCVVIKEKSRCYEELYGKSNKLTYSNFRTDI